MTNVVAIILARGGSKGIPKKNIMNFCGKPLLVWSIEHAKNVKGISSVWVSSDNNEILKIAKKHGANTIRRPRSLSTDTAKSVSAYLHAIGEIEKRDRDVDIVVALQTTSPVRESTDIEKGLQEFINSNYDSMFSGAKIDDFYIWKQTRTGQLKSINYNYRKRPRRQKFEEQYVENGSFYIFRSHTIRKYKNQLGGKIGITLMEFWKSFEIDDIDDVEFCKAIMYHYLLKKSNNR